MEPEGADVRRVLIAYAVLDKSRSVNGDKIFGRSTLSAPEGERVFTDAAIGSKSDVLQDDRIGHKGPPFLRETANVKSRAIW